MTAEQTSIPPGQDSSSTLFRIIYVSECDLPAEDGAYAIAINQLLKWSRDWNKDHELTGILMFSIGYFAQVLEGPKGAIKALIGNIVCDNRHQRLILLEAGPVSQRLFGNWSMAYTDGNEQLDLLLMESLDTRNESQGAAVLAMLRHIVMPDGQCRRQVTSLPTLGDRDRSY